MLPEFRYFSKNFSGKIANFAKSLFITVDSILLWLLEPSTGGALTHGCFSTG